jgi:hypothetical protein
VRGRRGCGVDASLLVRVLMLALMLLAAIVLLLLLRHGPR